MRYDRLIVDDEIALAETTSEYLNMFDVESTYVTSAEVTQDQYGVEPNRSVPVDDLHKYEGNRND